MKTHSSLRFQLTYQNANNVEAYQRRSQQRIGFVYSQHRHVQYDSHALPSLCLDVRFVHWGSPVTSCLFVLTALSAGRDEGTQV